ncbi:GOLPH3/VPS74 family protein [Streptomyces griseorubiginosus]|uniref:GOLPH3/VPS74 family protein n=1 Tax=Streptomyces griseorubiginosus TaxID=67304 RepID=UPI002E801BA2|nr:GPP34 family phosphoprotein [Streptomyces griseorubiginosus]WUB42976.1 GPP34 family phosphoprotein [Streptomyces griseorubiginosus]WUB51494.1 GPP34 family phosphoprotein [Streptomyces griseorubiginosus]
MTTARDLAIVALEVARNRSLEQGDLSLALAGAELLDLVDAGAIALDDDRIVPGPQAATGDRLLDEATTSLVRQEPYETVEDWLWRRGSELAAAYVDDLEKIGLTTRRRGGRLPLLSGRTVPVDSPARSGAEERRASGEPVLAALAAAAGVDDKEPEFDEKLVGEAATTVLAAVGDAVMELEAVRQRRAIESSAFDNVWRGGV